VGDPAIENAAVTAGIISNAEYYNFNDVKTDENGKLYLWLPVNETDLNVTADEKIYNGSLDVGANNNNTAALLLPPPT
jgi:hypothetical protein